MLVHLAYVYIRPLRSNLTKRILCGGKKGDSMDVQQILKKKLNSFSRVNEGGYKKYDRRIFVNTGSRLH